MYALFAIKWLITQKKVEVLRIYIYILEVESVGTFDVSVFVVEKKWIYNEDAY